MMGHLASLAAFASTTVLVRSSATGTSFTVWNRPFWWASRSNTVSAGSMSTFADTGALALWALAWVWNGAALRPAPAMPASAHRARERGFIDGLLSFEGVSAGNDGHNRPRPSFRS